MSHESFSMHAAIIVTLLASALVLYAKGNEYEKAKSVALINQSNNSIIEIGGNVNFTCKLNATKFDCLWFRNGDLLTDIPALIKTNKNKVTSCVHSIKNATLNDDGVYSCSFTSKSNPDFNITSQAAHLTVLRTPDEPSIVYEQYNGLGGPVPQILDIMDESEINFQCISKNGNPPAELKWFLNETEIHGNYSTKPSEEHEHLKTALNRFRLQSEISKNIGNVLTLECIATHELRNLTQTTHIYLKFPTPTSKASAHVVVIKTESNSSVMYHPNEVKIHCSADGNPAPNFHWEKLSHEGKWTNVANKSEIMSTNGTYRCAARNKYSKMIVFSPNITVNITVEHHDDRNSMNSATTIAVTILLMLTFIIVTIIGGYMYQKKCCTQKKKQSEYELVTQFTTNKTILAIEKD